MDDFVMVWQFCYGDFFDANQVSGIGNWTIIVYVAKVIALLFSNK